MTPYDFRRSGMPDGFTPPFERPSTGARGDGLNVEQQSVVRKQPLTPPSISPIITLPVPGAPDVLLSEPTVSDVNKTFELMKYSEFANNGQVIGTTDVLLLQGSESIRTFLVVTNESSGAQNIWIAFGVHAAQDTGIRIVPGGSFTFDASVPQNDLHVIASAAGAIVKIMFGNKPKPI